MNSNSTFELTLSHAVAMTTSNWTHNSFADTEQESAMRALRCTRQRTRHIIRFKNFVQTIQQRLCTRLPLEHLEPVAVWRTRKYSLALSTPHITGITFIVNEWNDLRNKPLNITASVCTRLSVYAHTVCARCRSCVACVGEL